LDPPSKRENIDSSQRPDRRRFLVLSKRVEDEERNATYEALVITSEFPFRFAWERLTFNGKARCIQTEMDAEPRSTENNHGSSGKKVFLLTGKIFSIVMQFDSNTIVVYGLPVADKAVARLVKRVIIVSVLSAIIVIVLTVLNFTIFRAGTTTVQTILSCIIGLCLPLLGWFGAKTNSRPAVGVFCCFSFGCGLFNLISYILLMVAAAFVDGYLYDCQPDGTLVVDGKVYTGVCDWTHDSIVNLYIIASCVTIPIIILQCLGGVFGSKLYSKLKSGVIITYNSTPYQGGYKDGAPNVPAVEVRNVAYAPPTQEVAGTVVV
jgi:hypothetical protein